MADTHHKGWTCHGFRVYRGRCLQRAISVSSLRVFSVLALSDFVICLPNPNVATVLISGGPIDLRFLEPYSPAIVQGWWNGLEGGTALQRFSSETLLLDQEGYS